MVVRLLGGRAYWAYGVDRLAAFCRERGITLGLLPGDAREDPELADRSTLGAEDRARLWGYLVHGGIGNSGQLLRFAATLLGRAEPWEEPRPLPPASLYAPGRPAPTLDEVTAGRRGRPVAAVLFYRALLQSGDLAPIDRLLAALDAEGLDAVALAVTSLKEPAAAGVVERVLAETGPDVVLNATGFAVSTPGAEGSRGRSRAATRWCSRSCWPGARPRGGGRARAA